MRPASHTFLAHASSSRRRGPMGLNHAAAFALCGMPTCCSWVGLVCNMWGLSVARGSGFSGRLSPRRGHSGDWVCGVPSVARHVPSAPRVPPCGVCRPRRARAVCIRWTY